jgi:hypothetical protein
LRQVLNAGYDSNCSCVMFSVNLTGHGGFVSGRLKVAILAMATIVLVFFWEVACVRIGLRRLSSAVGIPGGIRVVVSCVEMEVVRC